MKWETFLKWLSAELFGLASFLWGSLDGLLYALIAFMVLDFVTGLICGYKLKRLNSEVCFTGIVKKVLIMVLVAVGHILDVHVFGGNNAVLRTAVIGFYLANEGLSILENAGVIGLPLPKKLRKALEQLKDENENTPRHSFREDDEKE